MSHAALVIDLDHAGRPSSGVVHAPCFLRVNHDVQFPHPEWSDFVVVVLGWWVEACARVLRGELTRVAIRFMEGPFLVELHGASRERLRLVCVESGLRQQRMVADETIEALPLALSLLEASDEVLSFCEGRGWTSTDSGRLQTVAESLRKEVSALEKRCAPS